MICGTFYRFKRRSTYKVLRLFKLFINRIKSKETKSGGVHE